MKSPYFSITFLWLLVFCAYGADEPTLEQKLATLAQKAATEIRFVEEQHSWVLAEPVISEGLLKYDAGSGTLTKQVLKPEPMSLTISGDRIDISRGQQQRRLNIARDSPLHDMLLALRALLAGDAAALRRSFIVDYQSRDTPWRIRLTPRDPALGSKLARIEVVGRDDQVDSIEITLASGDRQLMRLQP
jgi:hypothetical protein